MTDFWLTGPVTSTAYGWRLERADGVTSGFTSHDRNVLVDGLTLRASPGMLPSAISESLGLESDGLDVKGALTSDAIRADDLAAGRWDNARLDIFLFDWSEPAAGTRPLASGELGAISFAGDAFEAEFLGQTRLLDTPIVPHTSPGCRARFCDNDCGLNPQRFVHRRTVASVSGSVVALSDPVTAGALVHGSLRWLEGKNAGLAADIIANDATTVTLLRAPHFAVDPGAQVLLTEGCDKRLETCATRFANAINFRGEPYLPGNDLLTRYPGA